MKQNHRSPTRRLALATAALVAALAAPVSLFSAMTNTPTPSQISAATVYTDRAIVTRTAHATLAPGETSIVLEKLPADLIDASVQVSGRGTAAASILDVTTRMTYTEETVVDQPRVTELQAQIKATEQILVTLNNRANILNHQVKLLDKIEITVAAPAGKEGGDRPTLEDLQKLLAFSGDSRAKLAADGQALDVERAAVNEKLATLHAQLDLIVDGSHSDGKSYKTVTVRVAAAVAGTLDLSVAYTVPNASWSPAYDVRMRSEERAVELSYFGIVRQSTGEDWNNIALTLSTARPSLGSAAPSLSPWIVDIFVPRPVLADVRRRMVAEEKMKSQAFNMVAASMAPAAEMELSEDSIAYKDATYAAASVDASATSATFKIVAATSIPSDNTPQKVSITINKLAAKLQYQATPSMQETAFLSAYVTNTTDFPFLGGPTNIFLDNAFVSTSSIKSVMPTEKFEVSLGADEGVSIKRRIVNRFTENTGLTGKGRRVTYEFMVTITNNKKTAERIVFKEALPLSRNEKIVVKLLSPNEKDVGTLEKPGKEVTREEDNKLVWRLDLKAGEKREIPVKFSIEYPSEIQVAGLE